MLKTTKIRVSAGLSVVKSKVVVEFFWRGEQGTDQTYFGSEDKQKVRTYEKEYQA